MSLTLRSLTFISENEIALVFDPDPPGEPVTVQFTIHQTRVVDVVSGSPEFSRRYRAVPGPALPDWPEQLVGAAWRARQEPLPDGAELDELIEDVRRQLTDAWEQSHDR
jgi:hypothetical protein